MPIKNIKSIDAMLKRFDTLMPEDVFKYTVK